MNFDVGSIKKQFPIFDQPFDGKKLVYLDNGATTLKPRRVIDRLDKYYKSGSANIHRGVYLLSEQATADYEGVREKVKNFLNLPSASEVIFTKGTTEAINLVAFSFGEAFVKEGDEIVVSEMEHHANIVPWQLLCERKRAKLRVIPINDKGELILTELPKLLNSKTKLIAVVHASNSLGTVNPVKKICEIAKKAGVPVLLDGAQGVSTGKVDVQDIGCDFYAFSAHKLFGPTGCGVLWGKKSWLDKMPPYQGGGDMIASVDFEKTTYNVVPFKFEAGTPPIAEVMALGEAIDFVTEVGLDKISAYEHELLEYATEQLQKIEGLRIVGTADEKIAIVSFVLGDIHPHDVGTLLDQYGVCVRTGHHCCQPVMKHFKVPATARASFSIYNTRDDVDKLVDALEKVKKVFSV